MLSLIITVDMCFYQMKREITSIIYFNHKGCFEVSIRQFVSCSPPFHFSEEEKE